MIHYGDITKLSGYTLPPVDVITGGSPCQDLSVAGKRAGLAGERSGLFMEQIRIVKEMRERDRSNGRTDDNLRPRYMVWENVPGAFSSNNGEDFQAVLTEIVRIIEPEAADVPMPARGGWPYSGILYDEMGNWSVAWRLHDAQFWGVPQRRKRIALVADFTGLSAGEVCFERKGMRRNPAESGEKRQRTPGKAESSTGETSACMTAWDVQSKRIFSPDGVSQTLNSGTTEGMNIVPSVLDDRESISFQERAGKPGGGKGILIQHERVGALSTLNNQAVLAAGFCTEHSANARGIGYQDETSPTLRAGTTPAVMCLNDQGGSVMDVTEEVTGTLRAESHGHEPIVYGMSSLDSNAMKSPNPHSGIYEADTARTLDCNGGNPGCNQGGMIVLEGNGARESHKGDGYKESDTMYTLNTIERHAVLVENHPADSRVKINEDGVCQSLTSRMGTGGGNVPLCMDVGFFTTYEDSTGTQLARQYKDPPIVATDYVRRLTPMECERLQGYPDGWTDIGEWVDSKGKKHKDSDAPRYKALGNSIALPFWFYILRRMAAQYERPATLGSLFDGIGGFPLCWERCNGKGTALWASEIEEFPIAVTKKHFPEECHG